jgi:uncharacterized protein (DUF1697 family)
MPRLVAFLRAINVGGHTVTMKKLGGIFSALGFTDVETFIASGNVVFSSRSTGIKALEQKIERRLQQALKYEVTTFIRTGVEVAAIAGYRPFTEAERRDAHTLSVGFVAEPLAAPSVEALMALRTRTDDFHAHGREVYWLRKTRMSESAVSGPTLEKALKARVTIRNVNTVMRLTAKYGFSAADD